MQTGVLFWVALAVLGVHIGDCVTTQIVPGALTCPNGTRYCEFKGNGICLNLEKHMCDGVRDCDFGSDEIVCNATSCKPGAFWCGGRCHKDIHKCDGHELCWDGTDEQGCGELPARSELWTCASDGSTRHKAGRCNGVNECADGSDEQNCSAEMCQGGAFWCDGVCRAASNRCDGWAACSDGQDEANCTY